MDPSNLSDALDTADAVLRADLGLDAAASDEGELGLGSAAEAPEERDEDFEDDDLGDEFDSADQGEDAEDAVEDAEDEGDEGEDDSDELPTGSPELAELRQQLAELKAQQEREKPLRELGLLAYQQRWGQQQQPPQPQGPPLREVEEALMLLTDRTTGKSEADVRAEFQRFPRPVQEQAWQVLRQHERDRVRQALDPHGYVRELVQPLLQQEIRAHVEPLQRQLFWETVTRNFGDVVKSEEDRNYVAARLARGLTTEDAVQLLRAEKAAREVAEKQSKVNRRDRDQKATRKARRRSAAKRNSRKGGKRRIDVKPTDDFEDIQNKVQAALDAGEEIDLEGLGLQL